MRTTSTTQSRPDSASFALYLGLIALLLVIIGLGYLAFRQFATQVTPQMGTFNLLALAIIAGIASFFSPCAFPLLPGYLAFYTTARGDGVQDSYRISAIGLGLAAAAGVVTFVLILGVIIGVLGAGAGQALSISGSEPSYIVLWFRGGVGIILVMLGLAQWFNVNLKPGLADKLAWWTRPNRDGKGAAAPLYFYGLGYTAAGMGCTGPILAGLTVFALSTRGFNAALTAFVIFAVTMVGLMLLVSGLVATSQETLIRRLKASAPRIKQVTSILLVLVGLSNIFTVLNTDFFVWMLFP